MNKLQGMNFTSSSTLKPPAVNRKKECIHKDCCCFNGETTIKGQLAQDQVSFKGPLTDSR